MGDGGVACVPIIHPFPISSSTCKVGVNRNTSNNSSSSSANTQLKNSAKKIVMKPVKKVKKVPKIVKKLVVKSVIRSNSNASGKVVENTSSGKVVENTSSGADNKNDANKGSNVNNAVNSCRNGGGGGDNSAKDEVEEGELGTLTIENGEFVPEKPPPPQPGRKFGIKSEIEKGEFVPERWRRDELEKGEFVPDRWRKSDVAMAKDDYGYSRSRRQHQESSNREWTPPPPSASGKYSLSEKELHSRSCGSGGLSQHVKRPVSQYDAVPERIPRISSKIVTEEGEFKNEQQLCSNGKNHAARDYSSNRLKRYGVETSDSTDKCRGEYDDYTSSSKSRKLSDDGARSGYSEHYSGWPVDRPHSSRNAGGATLSSARNLSSSDKYSSSRHYEASKAAYDRYNNSPRRLERSPHGRTHYYDYRGRSPARREKSPYDGSHHYDHSRSPYDRRNHYDRSRSPYDRSRHYDHRNRSPSYVDRSPQDPSRYQDRRDRTLSYTERSPQDHSRYHDRREQTPSLSERSPIDRRRAQTNPGPSRKSGTNDKRQSHYGSKGQEEKLNKKDPVRRDSQVSGKDPEGKRNVDKGTRSADNTSQQSEKEEQFQIPKVDINEPVQENGGAEELASMEEDMDICDTPPHVPLYVSVGAELNTGKWFYLDHVGVERGPSKLCDLKTLVKEGFLVSDHLIKHTDSDRWVTVETAVSPLMTANFPSVVSDSVTQMVSPPEAPGNLLADSIDLSQSIGQGGEQIPYPISSEPVLLGEATSETVEDLHIDKRVGELLHGFTVFPGQELEIVGQVLKMTFEPDQWERWDNLEGFTCHQYHHAGETKDPRSIEGFSGVSNIAGKEDAESRFSADKDNVFPSGDSSDKFSGQWSCKGGDWKRNDEATQDRSWRRKLVLNDGYPLCQMPKLGCEDPRWERKDELYYPSQSRRLDLPPWAFTSPDEGNDTSALTRSSQFKAALARGVKGIMLPVIRINACVVKDHGSFVSELRMKHRGKDKYSSRSSRPYSSSSDTKRSSEEGVSRSKTLHDQESQDSAKSNISFSIPKDRVCTAVELQMHLGDWYYLDGAGHERGPFSFSELKILADQGVIKKHSSVHRKMDRLWVPVIFTGKAFNRDEKICQEMNSACSDISGAVRSESMGAVSGSNNYSSEFHDLHPQFIGYTRGKLHELVMKSYRNREFAIAINEVLDPWINARQPKKETEIHIYNPSLFHKPDHIRGSKRLRIDGNEELYDLEEEASILQKDECSFDDLCGSGSFSQEGEVPEIGRGSWGFLNNHVLGRVFHYLRADMKSLVYASSTCKHWRSVVNSYKDISREVDLFSLSPSCDDSTLSTIMNGYNKDKITTLILRGCTSITSGTLEEVLLSLPCLLSIDIRGCSQFEDLSFKYPNINWVRSNRGSISKIRSLKYITDKSSSAYDGGDNDSSGLRDYLENSDKRDSKNQLFRQSLYKRSKLFDARKSSSLLSRDAHLRRLAMRKSEKNAYRGMEEFISSTLKEIMRENTFDFFMRKVAEIEARMKNGYYASRGLSTVKEDISRMCRDAIKVKNRGEARDMNRIIKLFIRLASKLEGGPKSYNKKDATKTSKDESPPGYSMSSLNYKKSFSKAAEKKYMQRSNGSLVNGISDYGDYASDREIRRRLSKLNKKSMDSGSETSDELDRSSDGSVSENESTDSDTESDLDVASEGGTMESRGESYFTPDDGLDSWADDREWGARMTKASLVPPVTRKYEVIDHYVVVADEEEVKRKMCVSLPENYTEKLNAQRNGMEESDMEIPEVKDYKPRKKLEDEVIEQEVYGIDPYTHNLLLDSMPDESEWSLSDKHLFIEDKLLCTLNKQVRNFTGTGNTPMMYPLKPVFEEILETAEEEYDRRIAKLCEFILKAIDSRPNDKYVAYRKGLGVVCNKEGGFGEDDFVVEFLGEVYPAWKWFEKQDGIRSLQKNNKDPAPEFYNIYLERPKGDGDGYDLVVVDAMHKANYASRICHSCRPNCEAKVTAVDGQYQIGIYTVRPIAYGEEVTFDYNSVTESKEEYEASVCLCGSQVCRGSYLNLTGEGAYQKVLKEYHGILDRCQLMLEACELNSVSEEDYIDLGKAGLGSCLLGGLPDWLIAYAARLVRFINVERTKLPDEILSHNLEEKRKYFAEVCLDFEKSDAEVQAEGVYNQRLQNLALTLDKVRYVMRCVFGDPKMAPPPLERLSLEEAVSSIWKGEGSLVEELLHCVAPHMEDNMLSDLKVKIRARDPSHSRDLEMELRKSLIWLRDEVRDLPCTYKCRHDAAADLIHIYAHTKHFFRIREYKSVTSPPVYISPLDLGPKYADKLGSATHEYCKTYGENYCLGQLIYWYNQANAEPDSSLLRASRGCLSLPDIGSFYAKVQKPSRQRIYGPRTVKFMLSRMEKQPQRPWPSDRIWSFKNSLKIVGSPMLDAVLSKVPLDREMVQWLKHRPPIFQAKWDR